MANVDIKNITDMDLSSDNLFKANNLFEDSESFMTEINDESEKEAILGGIAITSGCCISKIRIKIKL